MVNNNVGYNERLYRKLKAALRQRCEDEGLPCVLCLQPFDWSRRWPHPRSWTCHHLIPRALGGAPDDPDNMAPAHKVCNERYGTGPGDQAEQLVPPTRPEPYSEAWPT